MKITLFKTNLFLKDKNILINLIVSFTIFLFTLFFLYFKIEPQAKPIALKYTIYFGVSMIGPWYHVFFIPLMGIIIILINYITAYLIFLKIKILSYFLVIATSLIQILLLISAILIYLLNK